MFVCALRQQNNCHCDVCATEFEKRTMSYCVWCVFTCVCVWCMCVCVCVCVWCVQMTEIERSHEDSGKLVETVSDEVMCVCGVCVCVCDVCVCE